MNSKKTFSQLGLLLFLGTLLIFVVQMVFIKIGSCIPAIDNSGDLSFLISMLPMYIIAYPAIFFMAKKIPVSIEGEKKQMKPLHLFIAFTICYGATYICNYVGTFITTIIGFLKGGSVDNVILNITDNIHPITTLIVIAIIAPIMEELLFRKVLIDRTYLYGDGASIVFSGIVFGLFHGNLNQFAYAFVLGIFFGFIYIKTKNIVYPIILHMLINFIGSFLGSFILERSNYMEFAMKIQELSTDPALMTESALINLFTEYGGGLILFFCYAICLLLLALTGIILFIINRKKFILTPGQIAIEKGKRFATLFLNTGIILYSIFWIVMIIMQLFG